MLRNMIFVGVFITLAISLIGLLRLHQRRNPPPQQGDRHPQSERATPGSVVRLIASDLKYTVCAGIVAGLGLSLPARQTLAGTLRR